MIHPCFVTGDKYHRHRRGEALTTANTGFSDQDNNAAVSLRWHVLWTHSNFESYVYEKLSAKGYELFVAMVDQWVNGRKGKQLCRVPMFRSYIFLHHAVDKYDYIDICNTKGIVNILGPRWDRLACIPDSEIDSIKRVCGSTLPFSPCPYLAYGDKVRMTKGSLQNLEGIFLRSDSETGLLVVSVSLLNRSVAVEVNCTDVVPV